MTPVTVVVYCNPVDVDRLQAGLTDLPEPVTVEVHPASTVGPGKAITVEKSQIPLLLAEGHPDLPVCDCHQF